MVSARFVNEANTAVGEVDQIVPLPVQEAEGIAAPSVVGGWSL